MSADRYEIDSAAAWREIDGHIFIITVDSRQHELEGEVELAVWHRLQESPASLDDLIKIVVNSFEVDQSTAESDVGLFLTHLLKAGIVSAISV